MCSSLPLTHFAITDFCVILLVQAPVDQRLSIRHHHAAHPGPCVLPVYPDDTVLTASGSHRKSSWRTRPRLTGGAWSGEAGVFTPTSSHPRAQEGSTAPTDKRPLPDRESLLPMGPGKLHPRLLLYLLFSVSFLPHSVTGLRVPSHSAPGGLT